MSRAAPVLANDFRAQWRAVREDVLAAVDRVGESGWLVLGNEVRAFEAELAAWHGLPHCVGTANGLDALEIGLRCLGVGPGDVVLTTPLTAFATTLAVIRVGATPAYADVDASGLLDLDATERALASRRDVRAVVPVHLYGHALDLARLREIGERFGVPILEDCAQAIGARHRGAPVGSASRISATSFYPTKNLGCLGDGGAVFTTEPALRDRAASLRDYGQTAKYVHGEVGMNSRLDELQAAILRSALLPRLTAFTDRRREIARVYLDGIRNGAVRPLPVPEGSESVWHLFPVAVDGDRDAFHAHCKELGVATGVHYPILASDQKAAGEVLRLGPLDRAAALARSEVSLPIHPFLDDAEVARVVDACNAYRPR